MDEKKLFTVLSYIPKLSDKLKRILKNINLMSPLNIQTKYRAFSTVAKIKPATFWVEVFIEFPVLVAVFVLEEPNNN